MDGGLIVLGRFHFQFFFIKKRPGDGPFLFLFSIISACFIVLSQP